MYIPTPHRMNQNKIHYLNEKLNPQPENEWGGVRGITGTHILMQFFQTQTKKYPSPLSSVWIYVQGLYGNPTETPSLMCIS